LPRGSLVKIECLVACKIFDSFGLNSPSHCTGRPVVSIKHPGALYGRPTTWHSTHQRLTKSSPTSFHRTGLGCIGVVLHVSSHPISAESRVSTLAGASFRRVATGRQLVDTLCVGPVARSGDFVPRPSLKRTVRLIVKSKALYNPPRL